MLVKTAGERTPEDSEFFLEGSLRSPYVSPSFLKNRTASFSFEKEASLYLRRWTKFREPSEVRLARRFSNQIRLGKNIRTVTVMPAHVTEPDVVESVLAYKNQDEALRTHHIVVFFNADKRMNRETYATLLRQQTRALTRATKDSRIQISVINHHFVRATMGCIRGLATDATVISALRSKLRDPIVISNDSDQSFISKTYLSSYLKAFDRRPVLDAAEGSLFQGNYYRKNDGNLTQKIAIPELFLRSHYITAMKDYGQGWNISPATVHLWGNNSCFRLSTYCAIGGYSYELIRGEDSDIARRIEALRLPRHSVLATFTGQFVDHVKEAYLVTNPRRTLHAILSGQGVWAFAYDDTLGSAMDLSMLLRRYRNRSDLLQEQDLKLARRGNRGAIRKIKDRVQAIFVQSARDYEIGSAKVILNVAAHFGLKVTKVRNFERPIWEAALDTVEVDCKKSPILKLLGI
jgi:hypothetical protein